MTVKPRNDEAIDVSEHVNPILHGAPEQRNCACRHNFIPGPTERPRT
jgi:hypothetical protein